MPKASIPEEGSIQERFCSLLLDSASSETMPSLPSLIKLQKAIRSPVTPDSLTLWQVKMVIAAISLCPSVPSHFIESLKSFVSHKIRGKKLELKEVQSICPEVYVMAPLSFFPFLFFISFQTECDWKEILRYLKGESSLTETSSESAQVILLADLPPFSSLSPLQGKENKKSKSENIFSDPFFMSQTIHVR